MEYSPLKKGADGYWIMSAVVKSVPKNPPENIELVNGKFYPLKRFFSGKLEESQIAQFKELPLAAGAFEAQYLPLTKVLVLGPTERLTIMWQFGDEGEVNFINIAVTSSIVDFELSEFIPRRFHATKMAVIAYTDDEVNIKCIHLLTGLVTSTDPIHELIRKDRK